MIDSRAVISPQADIASDVHIGPFTVIGADVTIDSSTAPLSQATKSPATWNFSSPSPATGTVTITGFSGQYPVTGTNNYPAVSLSANPAGLPATFVGKFSGPNSVPGTLAVPPTSG